MKYDLRSGRERGERMRERERERERERKCVGEKFLVL